MSQSGKDLTSTLQSHLTRRKTKSSLRTLTLAPPNSTDFSSNDFLSLSTSPLLKSSFLTELSNNPDFRLGSGGSRLLDGNSSYAENLESSIAEFHNAEAALLFNSGYDANTGFFSCIPQEGDVVLWDEKCHASCRVGIDLSRASLSLPFAHNSVSDLRTKLLKLCKQDESFKTGRKNVFVAVESLYSMDGDLAPLKDIVECVEDMLQEGNGYVIVDEAHSNGIYGEKGRGIVCALGLERRVFARLNTFGKGLGCSGATILCSKVTREYLINYAKPLIYSTSMSFPSLAAIKVAYEIMKEGRTEALIQHLRFLTRHFHSHLLNIPPTPLLTIPEVLPESPIFALMTPTPRNLARFCQEGGFMVRPIVSPTVAKGTERVRVCLHAGNSYEEVESLARRIARWMQEREGTSKTSEVSEIMGTKAHL
ncbi:pyridoxal phosphate-dependent transferase [Tricladium varicosporioides]|nr:pyridoxal phosphate-dependent transferase [Hymenoscyphus varicosporioides]